MTIPRFSPNTMRTSRKILLLAAFSFVMAVIGAGEVLCHPARRAVGQAPPDLQARSLRLPYGQGETLSAWMLRGQPGQGAVLLLHGVRADRREMLGRARFLNQLGYAVLLPDLLSPHIAAARAGTAISIPAIVQSYRQLATRADAVVVEGAGGFALHRGTDDAVAGGSPGIGAGSDGGGLAGASPADRGLEPVAALAPRPNQVALFTGQMRVAGERGGEVVVGDVVGAFVATGPEPCCDAVLHLEHRSGGEQRLVAVGERDHMTRREEPVGQLEDLGRATEEWLGDTVGIGDPDVRDRGDGVGSGEHRPTGTDPVIGREESVDGLCPIPLAIRLAIPLGIRLKNLEDFSPTG